MTLIEVYKATISEIDSTIQKLTPYKNGAKNAIGWSGARELYQELDATLK